MKTKKIVSLFLALLICMTSFVFLAINASAKMDFVINFDANGGEGSETAIIHNFTPDEVVPLPDGSGMSREGYIFMGWSKDKNATTGTDTYSVVFSDFDSETFSLTFYAVWQKLITVNFDTNGGIGTMTSKSGNYQNGDAIDVPDSTGVTRANYQLIGWNVNANASTGANTYTFNTEDVKDGTVTLYAIWQYVEPAKQPVKEPEVIGTYKYNGKDQTVILRGDQSHMTTVDSITKKNAGTYVITFTLEEGYEWADGSDGVVTWQITEGTHWFALALLLVFVGSMAICWFVLKTRKFFTDGKFNLLPAIILATDLVLLVIIACFAQCFFCTALLIVDAVLLAFLTVLYLDIQNITKKQIVEEQPAEETPVEPTPAEETPAEEEEAPAEEETSPEDGLALKDAMALAVANANNATEVNKKTVAEFLNEGYGEQAITNCRANYIKSGLLPLADTHYKMLPNGKKCFMYVYELKGGQVFFLVRANENVAKEIAEKHPSFTHSAYPKTKLKDWYTMVLDNSYASSADVFDTLAFIFENFASDEKQAFRSSVDVMTAHTLYTNKQIEGMMVNKEVENANGKEEIINVDTLSQNFSEEDTVNLAVLQEKKLISNQAKRVKVLARGVLDKKLKVEANAFSYDAAKMIAAVGGTVIRLKDKK